MLKVRLNETEINCLISKFKTIFSDTDELWLFGSRVDLTKKGGDIDLFIRTNQTYEDALFTMQIKFLASVKNEIGEQKIDVVIQTPKSQHQKIFDVALEHGVRLT